MDIDILYVVSYCVSINFDIFNYENLISRLIFTAFTFEIGELRIVWKGRLQIN